MKHILIKIIFGFCIVFSINACHTFEHQNIFNQNISKNSNVEVLNKKNKSSKFTVDESTNNSEMAPIEIPKQIETVQKLALQKKVEIPNANQFSLDKFINWNEEKLIKTLGKSHFVKEEGKLKNFQYYFSKCFLDIYLIDKKNSYYVDLVKIRPTELNGKIDMDDCLKEIDKNFN